MEPLCDPLNDRFMKTVRAPPHRPLSRNLMWPNKNSGNFAICIAKFNETKYSNIFHCYSQARLETH